MRVIAAVAALCLVVVFEPTFRVESVRFNLITCAIAGLKSSSVDVPVNDFQKYKKGFVFAGPFALGNGEPTLVPDVANRNGRLESVLANTARANYIIYMKFVDGEILPIGQVSAYHALIAKKLQYSRAAPVVSKMHVDVQFNVVVEPAIATAIIVCDRDEQIASRKPVFCNYGGISRGLSADTSGFVTSPKEPYLYAGNQNQNSTEDRQPPSVIGNPVISRNRWGFVLGLCVGLSGRELTCLKGRRDQNNKYHEDDRHEKSY
jgi:hypothetical protein